MQRWLALKYDSRILIEQGVVAWEIEGWYHGNTAVKTTDPGEVVKTWLSMIKLNTLTIRLPWTSQLTCLQSHDANACLCSQGLPCSWWLWSSHHDFFLLEDGAICLNRLNTRCQVSLWSMYPLLWENMGLHTQTLSRVVALGRNVRKTWKPFDLNAPWF